MDNKIFNEFMLDDRKVYIYVPISGKKEKTPTLYVNDGSKVIEDIREWVLKEKPNYHLVLEGAGATGFAALLKGKIDIEGKRVACVLSGGNIDVEILNRVLNIALINKGRLIEFSAEIYDRPGSLSKLIADISLLRGNIIQVQHNRTHLGLNANRVITQFIVETKNEEHARQIYDVLSKKEYILRWEKENEKNY